MGLTNGGAGAALNHRPGLHIEKEAPEDRLIALAGNPNVGKSTVFNSLTGLNQHTGNWPGKTVTHAQGRYRHKGASFILVDIPGTYSLAANSAEEEVARDFLCFGQPDAVVVVADATCLERNLNLVLQTLELTDRVVVCVNLIDEAEKKKIRIDPGLLEAELGVPVVATSARRGRGLDRLMDAVDAVSGRDGPRRAAPVTYGAAVERAVSAVAPVVEDMLQGRVDSRWAALRLLEGDPRQLRALEERLGFDPLEYGDVSRAVTGALARLSEAGITRGALGDRIAAALVRRSESLSRAAVIFEKDDYAERDRRLDRILTARLTGIPLMLLLLFCVFWLTITGANYPSALLAGLFGRLGGLFAGLLTHLNVPGWLVGALADGVFKTLAWVVAVMLPPMAIFFPLFTLLEDSGYLPRIAFNLDNFFRKACAHGKQSLTMCLGFGCNAAGVVGCRIIDSPRERLIATITNSFVPCNGRFPTLIALISMFLVGAAGGMLKSAASAVLLTCVIVLGVAVTVAVSKILSKTVLKGLPSAFNLELPPYRRPQIGRVIIRSIFDKTLFVLGRAAAVAAPAGLLIWLLANIHTGGISLLARCAAFLDPAARLLGMDGYILFAFVLGFPANEIVIPIIIMSYTSTGSLADMGSLSELRALLIANGWTWLTAVCVMLFSLMHWPCATTCLTIRKETGSLKWTLLSIAIPTAAGALACMAVAAAARALGLA